MVGELQPFFVSRRDGKLVDKFSTIIYYSGFQLNGIQIHVIKF